jgi:UDP-N-acetyl-D-mannosaminuronic acid transferase (WecB/TagA/CpsF family)
VNASVHISALKAVPQGLGNGIEEHSWTAAFERADAMLHHPHPSSTITFSRGLIEYRTLSEHGESVARARLAVSNTVRLAGISARLFGPGLRDRFTASLFVPAFLTFAEKSRRIGLVGTDVTVLKSLRTTFSRHAPWHRFEVVDPSSVQEGGFDLVIADLRRPQDLDRLVHLPAIASASLTVVANDDLFRLPRQINGR